MKRRIIDTKDKMEITEGNFSHKFVFVIEYDGEILYIPAKVTKEGFIKIYLQQFKGFKKMTLKAMITDYREPSLRIPPTWSESTNQNGE